MSLFMNGTKISVENLDAGLVLNGVNIENVYANGNLVYSKKAPAGSETFLANGAFVVPKGYTEVTVHISGGGGGGAGGNASTEALYGGYAGEFTSTVVSVSELENISVVIGSGGSGRWKANGNPGGESSFGGLIVSGGAGGSYLYPSTYAGNGASRTLYETTYYDGIKGGSAGGSWFCSCEFPLGDQLALLVDAPLSCG